MKDYLYSLSMAWYSHPAVKFELIKFLKNREFALLVPTWLESEIGNRNTRTLRCHSVQHLDFILRRMLKVKEKGTIYNMYYSMARYEDGIPKFSPNLSQRDTTEWVRNHYLVMESYDWLIDIDAGDHKEIDWAFDSAKMVKKLFDKLKMPYELRFSGCGFHFVVPYSCYSHLNLSLDPKDDVNVYKFLTNMSRLLSENYSEMIDWKIPDSRRVAKLPYSIALYKNDSFMCVPFKSDKEFRSFKLSNMRPYIWKGLIRSRGTYMFNSKTANNIDGLVKHLK